MVGTVVYFLFGYLVFDLILGPFSIAHTTALPGFKKDDEQTLVWILFSCLAYASLLSIILINWQNEYRPGSGFAKGAVIGTLIACMTDFYWYGTSHFFNNFLPVAADIAAAGLTVGIMGLAIVWAGRK